MAPAAHQSASPELPLALRESASWPNVEDYLARYPALDGCTNPAWPATRHTQWTLWWDLDGEQERHVLDDRLILYRGQRMAFPTIAADRTTAVHPLMAWWSVLFALSMLTRYAPSDWTRLTDIDRTPQATAIEFVLDRAVDAIPDLVDEAIAAVSSNASPSGSIGA